MSQASTMPSPRPIWTGRATLGEGPLWSPQRQRLFFVDILGDRIISCTITGDAVVEWKLDANPCWIIEHANGEDFLVGLAHGVVVARLEPGKPFEVRETIAWPEPVPESLRFNDAKADADGRVYCGTMDDAEAAPLGAFYGIAPDGSVTQLDQGYTVSNGPAISPDGRTLYHTDSSARTVYAFDRASDGSVSDKRVHILFTEDEGYPDGMTCDAEGGLWVCHWDGHCITRFLPDGTRDRTIALPVSRVTSCAFCGPALNQLAITTAAHERPDEALAGALFITKPGFHGPAPCRYGLAR